MVVASRACRRGGGRRALRVRIVAARCVDIVHRRTSPARTTTVAGSDDLGRQGA